MKIKNKSVKPICFGDITVLPGETKTVLDIYKDAVDFYVKMGYVVEVEKKAATTKNTSKTDGKNSSKTADSALSEDDAGGSAREA